MALTVKSRNDTKWYSEYYQNMVFEKRTDKIGPCDNKRLNDCSLI